MVTEIKFAAMQCTRKERGKALTERTGPWPTGGTKGRTGKKDRKEKFPRERVSRKEEDVREKTQKKALTGGGDGRLKKEGGGREGRRSHVLWKEVEGDGRGKRYGKRDKV